MADRSTPKSYLVTFANPIFPASEKRLRMRFSRTMSISSHAFMCVSPEEVRTVFTFVREIVGEGEAVFVARLQRPVEAESVGMHESAEREYGYKPSRRVLRSLEGDVEG